MPIFMIEFSLGTPCVPELSDRDVFMFLVRVSIRNCELLNPMILLTLVS